MSKKHPSFTELERKQGNIEIERNHVSTWRAKRNEKGEVEYTKFPIKRIFQIPFELVLRSSKAIHDARGPCAREGCAFRNTTAEALLNRLALAEETI